MFRAKGLEDKEWRFGDFRHPIDNHQDYKPTITIRDWDGRDKTYGYYDKGADVGVDIDTLCQYTGMEDKNGKQIYEGDIVKFDDTPYNAYGSKYIGVVTFYKGCWCVKYKWNLSKDYIYPNLYADDFAEKKTEILGNIFDNPDLIPD